MSDLPFFDEYGRGPLAREYQRRCGFDPAKTAAGFASFARALERRRGNGNEFPEQFRTMLESAVMAIVTPMLDAQLITIRLMIEEILNEKLQPVREAYAELRRNRQSVTPSQRGSSKVIPSGTV